MADETVESDLAIKIVILGNSGVGKTCLLEGFKRHDYEINSRSKPSPTLGADFASEPKDIKIGDRQIVPVKVQVWDTAGQERFQKVILNYCRGAHVFLLVFETPEGDLEQYYQSLRALTEWSKKICDTLDEGERSNTIFAICMSKYDRFKHLKEPKRLGEQTKEVVAQICNQENDVKRVYLASVAELENKNQNGEYYVRHMFDDLIYRATLLQMKLRSNEEIINLRDPDDTSARFQYGKTEVVPQNGVRNNSMKYIIRLKNKSSTLNGNEEQSGCC